MKVIVDLDTCDAHGECTISAPEVFTLDEGADVVTLLDPEPPEELWDKVREAESMCPVAAITIED